jgi:diguanylate cyclase (GGDEF)-like protein
MCPVDATSPQRGDGILSSNGLHWSHVGVTGRLVALVMMPVTMMCVFAGSEVKTRWSTEKDAVAIDRGVVDLSSIVELHGALEAQKFTAAFEVRIVQLGVTVETASSFMGIDLAAEFVVARASASTALAALGERSPVDAAAIDALWGDIDRGELTPAETVERFRLLEEPIARTVTARVNELEERARRAGARLLVDALESLRVADAFADLALPEGDGLSAAWFPAAGQTPADAQAVLSGLAMASASFAASAGRIRDLNIPTVVAVLDSFDGDPRIQAFETAVDAAVRREPISGEQAAAQSSVVFQGYLARNYLLNQLTLTAGAAVRDGAQSLARSQRDAFLAWSGLAALVSALSLAVALGFARSIAKPLRELAVYAHAINEGRLDTARPPTADRGPRETRLAVAVFVDLVANLQLLDAKANALASCAFDDPVLSQKLPGRLGRSLESSVAMLSGSIVERDRLQTFLAHQATHDPLTGIANRAAAAVGIEEAIRRATRSGSAMAVLFVDLNDFKSINDRFGHEAGDEVLRQVGQRMSACARHGDLVARLGGDEFIVISEGLTSPETAMELARRVLEAVSAPIDIGSTAVAVGAAIGVALTLDGPEEPLHLLARADAAMYRAKHHDRSAIEMFDAALQRQMLEREDVEIALSRAMNDPGGGGLHLHYQPVLRSDTGALVGLEALIRWDRTDHGLLQPDSFVPIAEATALIIDLDRWVLGEVSRRLVSWTDSRWLAAVPVAVNISGRHLQSGRLASHLATLLETSGIAAQRLTIEITETVLLDDFVAAASELEAVRKLGIRVAIDDFGTGYTSLAHLQHLPIDVIKVDRTLVTELVTPRGAALVRAVTDLGHAFDLEIIAEGVESETELAALQALGVDQLQGFLLARPLDASAVEAWAGQRPMAVGADAFHSAPLR